ncbi:putative nuclease NUC1 precursor mitochondrial [Zalerion maritima]|uniref:Endonuclease n=1 Tax=Zalerion maritima TaxID=339359 RepID=A0AAD5S5Z2_9PEZI|nr:putative nuclease NUC1 precursor mitochondrial [Zalerion maritima]
MSAKMSKSTVAIIAAVSAGTGAAVTAAIMNSSSSKPSTTVARPPSVAQQPQASPPASIAPIVAVPVAVPSGGAAPPTITPAGATGPINPSGVFEYGFPGPIADVSNRPSLVSSYDRRLRNPHWVVEHITPESLALRNGDRKHSSFLEDPIVPQKFRGLLSDYYRSGFDRGHQVPAADCKWSQQAMDDTFYLTNMCPQVGEGFNRDYWAHLEDFCRRLAGAKYPSVRIVTGPLYLPRQDPQDKKWYVKYEMIGTPPSIAVPTHFYKVIFAEDGKKGGSVAVGAFVLPNARIPNETPLESFEVPIEAVERASGLEFATKLSSSRRKRLCADTSCSIMVREYADRQKAFRKK